MGRAGVASAAMDGTQYNASAWTGSCRMHDAFDGRHDSLRCNFMWYRPHTHGQELIHRQLQPVPRPGPPPQPGGFTQPP
eukprot:7346442-Prymnesium_polylepis.2